MSHPSVLPLRPLTLGELLDSAVALVRTRSRALFAAAAAMAVVEQAILWPLRYAVGVELSEFSMDKLIGWFWWVLVLGAGLEAMIINGLGPIAGRLAARDLAGQGRGGRTSWWPALITAPVAGLATLIGAAFFFLAWPIGYALFGLSGAASTIERRGPFSSLGRAAALAAYSGSRASGVRILGYLGWLVLRLGFFIGIVQGLSFLPAGLDPAYYEWIVVAGLLLANTVAYATLAALDAVTLLEVRIRAEGMDVWLNRATANGSPLSPDLLAAHRGARARDGRSAVR